MKFVYLHPKYVLSVLIIGLNITCTKFWILWICTEPTSYLNPISSQNMIPAKWWNTNISYQRLGTFIRPVRHEEKYSQEKLWIWLAAGRASSQLFPHWPPGASIYAKQEEILAAKDRTICREGSPVILHKWPLLRSLSKFFLISELYCFEVSISSLCALSLPCMRLDHDSCQVMKFVYMRTTWSVAIQNMGLKLD